jgi:hypothetical protein
LWGFADLLESAVHRERVGIRAELRRIEAGQAIRAHMQAAEPSPD